MLLPVTHSSKASTIDYNRQVCPVLTITKSMLLLEKTIHANQLIHTRRDARQDIILESLISAKFVPTSSSLRLEQATEQGIMARDEALARAPQTTSII
jgi:hypothetical protein